MSEQPAGGQPEREMTQIEQLCNPRGQGRTSAMLSDALGEESKLVLIFGHDHRHCEYMKRLMCFLAFQRGKTVRVEPYSLVIDGRTYLFTQYINKRQVCDLPDGVSVFVDHYVRESWYAAEMRMRMRITEN